MVEVNQFAISSALGSTMSARETPRFGRMSLLPLVASLRRPTEPAITPGQLGDRHDEAIVQALKDVSQKKLGKKEIMGRDRLLADPQLAMRFVQAAKKLGVDAPPALIKRRLMRLGKIGGRLPKATEKDPKPSINDRNAFAIEYGVVRIAHLYGATVDDILCEDYLGLEYQKIVESLAPGYAPQIYRLGALYLRKTRNLKSAKKDAIRSLDPCEIEASWVDLGSVNEVKESTLATIGPGILDLDEPGRSLYIAKTDSVADLASTFLDPQLWDAIGNHFWHPNMERIHMKVLPQAKIQEQATSWELRLIQTLEPVFNIRVGKDAA
jgi:hypothetical protein